MTMIAVVAIKRSGIAKIEFSNAIQCFVRVIIVMIMGETQKLNIIAIIERHIRDSRE